MAEEATTPPPASALSGQQGPGRTSESHSSQSTSQEPSQHQSHTAHPSPATGMMSIQNSDQSDRGPGLYAVSTFPPSMALMSGFPPGTLIPLTYKIPTRTSSTGTGGEVQGQAARQPQGPQRQVVVRRFQFAIQLDLGLMIKLAALVFLFSQEGSRHRFILLVLFAALIYLYQTGALATLFRWIGRSVAPAQQRPVAQHVDGNQPLLEGNPPQLANQNQQAPNEQAPDAVANANPPEPAPELARPNENLPWRFLKEIQMLVVGFITSLLPGFHNHND
ncbi:hypothetical protein AXF42_Ash001886 [Apostasia shenzhenica]|uniref:Uncharacterized protein n=1 Tax=Apostasia shenzhenica TaxID=1088818 RepID=A0A2I0ABL2_9ASPA|nr:hypothetical protein AXF42_Ash001886 [Apostasia shenzhenica]